VMTPSLALSTPCFKGTGGLLVRERDHAEVEFELLRQYGVAAEGHCAAVRQFLLARETSARRERERLMETMKKTRLQVEAAHEALVAAGQMGDVTNRHGSASG